MAEKANDAKDVLKVEPKNGFSWVELGVKVAAPLIIKGIDYFFNRKKEADDKKKKEEDDKYLEEKFSRKLDELKAAKEAMEKKNEENEKLIQQLKEMVKNNNEQQKKKELQRQQELIEKERKKREEEIEENRKLQEALLKCKESLNDEFTKGIMKAMRNYSEQQEKWLNNLNDENIQNKLGKYKKQLNVLFQELFEFQKLKEKIAQKFIEIIKKNVNDKELNKMNFMIIGTSGVGKSTLINELFGEKVAQEGTGKRCTTIGTKYNSKNVPFLTLYDSVGTEIGQGHTLEEVQNDTLEEITKNLNINNPNEHIHCIIYCTSSNRIFEDELKVIMKLREKYDGKRLPIVIVFTRADIEEEVQAKKEAINEFLHNYGEEINNDIFGISYIPVRAREQVGKKLGKKYCDPCFGLSELMSTCYKKGGKSYKIAIKNSLIEIAKNCFYKYIQNVTDSLVNELNFYFYLTKKYEPNFPDFISYAFEKITDVENQEGVTENELRRLNNYLGNKTIGNTKNINKTPKNNISKKNQNNELNDKVCIYCKKRAKFPYKCECGTYACENCYLNQFNYNDSVKCRVCYKAESYISCQGEIGCTSSEETNNQDDYDNQENNIIENDDNEQDSNNNDIILNVLPSNLNYESKNSIEEYVKAFKKEMLEVVNEKFEDFINKEVQLIYYNILEKYNENANKGNVNMKNVMKSKEELQETASNEIKAQLKKPAQENFLKAVASNLFQDIIKTFEKEMVTKVKEFIKNLKNNNEVNEFVQSFDLIQDENKSLKIEKDFEIYIKKLQKKELDSQERALKIQENMEDNMGDSAQSESKMESSSSNIYDD